MGSCLSADRANGSGSHVVLFLGLDGSGATTILYQLVLGKHLQTIPTLGNNHESLNLHGLKLDCWDIGGLEKMRHLWVKYSAEADGIIFVVDASDSTRLKMAAKELRSVYKPSHEQKQSDSTGKSTKDHKNENENENENGSTPRAAKKEKAGDKNSSSPRHIPLSELPLLILANKQDLPNAASVEEIAEALEVEKLPCKYRQISPCSAMNHDSLVEAVKWMTDHFKEQAASRRKLPVASH